MKKIIALALAVLFALACIGCSSSAPTEGESATAEKPAETTYLTFAAPPASSATYPYWVSLGKAVSTVYPEYQISVSESQGAIDITKRVRSGESDLGNSMSCTDFENLTGTGTFDGDPNADARILFYYEQSYEMFCVSKESGVKSLSDLAGKTFNPGGTGGTSAQLCYSILELFGIEPDYFEAGQADAADAYADRTVIGTVKLGPLGDSYVLQLDAATPVTIISMTDEEVEKIVEAFPYLMKVVIPAGTFDGIDEDVTTVSTLTGAQATTKLSQEDGYKIVSAVLGEGKEIWQAAYPSGAENDYITMTLSSPIPLHAGMVQYLQENGYEVPENLIPPEYVAK